jgi:D-beta-D-heptose 7-phosphate kinase/D-beta-D-heptose 1-phosphate adenosyltransferase
LESVNGVCLFDGNDARAFLKFSQPNIYVKGGDYNIDTVNQDERQYIENNGGRIVILSNREGRSSSTLIDQIKNTPSA